MPLMSSDIAGQVGMFQQQTIMFGQQANMISETMQRGADPQQGAPWMAGRAMNMAAGVGLPVGAMAMGMAGLDPIGLGMRAGSLFGGSGAGMFGMARPALGMMAGIGTMGVASAAVSAGSYAAGQMWQGAQQQQAFQGQMQQAYRFNTPQGQGFTNNQLGVIGQNIRGMAGQVGSNGEMTGMNELSTLAANMGRMGMGGSGAQDVQQFTQRFRQMLDTVKTVAKELGSSLESAQQTMSQMRGSGVFKAADQVKMAGEMRAYSLGGNLGTSELSSMASMGSQISRMVGGRGKAGAFAGMRTLGQIGMSMEAGVLNEEDIYNATGLTGAEGRQAFAASQLQNSASWLKGSKGRRFLASVAGEDGKLDASSVNAWMSGDMSTGSTMGQAYGNLNKVGRANFIRNEGKLRGSALEQFGGNIPAMALMQWAGSRGIDVNTMNDREMLFAQRHTGMGMEELEGAVKMLKGMPGIQAQANRSAMTDSYRQDLAGARRTTGIEGAKRSFEHARETIQNKLQGVGSQMYSDLTGHIEDWLQKQSGMIVQQASADIDKTYEAMLRGDKSAGAKLGATRLSDGAVAMGAVGGAGGSVGGITLEAFNQKTLGMFGQSMSDKMSANGFGSFFKGKGVTAGMNEALSAYNGMNNFGDAQASSLGEGLRGLLQNGYATGIGELKGGERMAAVRELLKKDGSGGATELLGRLENKNTEEAYAALASAEGGFGLAKNNRVGMASKLPVGLQAMSGEGETERERVERYGRMGSPVAQEREKNRAYHKKNLGDAFGAVTGALVEEKGIGQDIAGGLVDATYWMSDLLSGKNIKADTMNAGTFLKSQDGMDLSRQMLGGTDIRDTLERRVNSLTGGTDDVKRERSNLRGMMGANEALQMSNREKRSLTQAELDAIDDKNKIARGSSSSMIQASSTALTEQTAIDRREALRMYGRGAQEKISGLQETGLLNASGGLQGVGLSNLDKIGGGKATEHVRGMMGLLQLQAEGAKAGLSNEDTLRIKNELQGKEKENKDKLYSMSVGDMRKEAAALREAGDFGDAQAVGQEAGFRDRAEKTLRAKGALGAAGILGLKARGAEARTLWGAKAGDGKLASYLNSKLGLQQESTASLDDEIARMEKAGSQSHSDKEKLAGLRSRKEGMESSNKDVATLRDQIKGLDAAKTPEERARMLSDIQAGGAFQNVEKRNREKSEMNDPGTKHLATISKASERMAKTLATIADNTANGGKGVDSAQK